jgi:hypothetical protein
MNATTRMRYPRRGQVLMGLVGLLLMASAGCIPTAAQSTVPPTSSPTAPATTAPATTAPATTAPAATVPRPIATATSEAQIPAGWAAYSNGQRCLYAISYPMDMQVTEQSADSQLIRFEVANPDEGARNFAYVSVIDKDTHSTSAEGVYNFDPAETDILLTMQIGESKPVREVLDIAKWFTYQRMPDKLIGGYAAQTYVNVQPWEFPAGTKEIRYYLLLNGCTYLIGGYVDTTNSDLPGAITEELFDQIVATIRLGQ